MNLHYVAIMVLAVGFNKNLSIFVNTRNSLAENYASYSMKVNFNPLMPGGNKKVTHT